MSNREEHLTSQIDLNKEENSGVVTSVLLSFVDLQMEISASRESSVLED